MKYKNKAKCTNCGDVIESTHRHDFIRCKCGDIAIDGGNDYHKVSYKNINSFERIYEELKPKRGRPKKIQKVGLDDFMLAQLASTKREK
jgi:predicted RNA-binding Zn-ribbon protein involved in translation (DUF1610 family)